MKKILYSVILFCFCSSYSISSATNLSDLLKNSLFDNTYVITVLEDEPLVIDKDIYLNNKNLLITAINISIPNDVTLSTFTGDQSSQPAISPAKPRKAANGRAGPHGGHRAHGTNGAVGIQGRNGNRGLSGGKVKIISKNSISTAGKLTLNLYGQNGGKAQNGGEGGNGGRGGNAHNGSANAYKCKRQPGDGGNGGHGGTGGRGGNGGQGGDGSLLIISPNLVNHIVKGNMMGGKGGDGGLLGRGGAAGAPGSKGSRKSYCQRSSRHGFVGQRGSQGNNGSAGPQGRPGSITIL